jgi:hypothetical protein
MTHGASCTNLSNLRTRQPQGHTIIAVVFDVEPGLTVRWRYCDDPAQLSKANHSLGFEFGELDLTPEAAISVLKEWYAKNPIELDSSEANVQGMILPEELSLAGLSMDESTTDETSTTH